MILRMLTGLITGERGAKVGYAGMFHDIVGFEGIKRTFLRSLGSKEPVHILLVGPPGQAKTLFLKCILEKFGEKEYYITIIDKDYTNNKNSFNLIFCPHDNDVEKKQFYN
jgi:MoxR-like ATPase